MDADSQPLKGRDGALSLLSAAIEAVHLANDLSSITPAKAVFASVGTLLTMIRVCVPFFSDDLLQIHA